MSSSLGRRAFRALTDPERLSRILRRYHNEYQFRRLALRSRPIPVPGQDSREVHVLFGHAQLRNAIATLKSLYRFLPEPYALAVHDDGTLDRSDVAVMRAHFPGLRLIPRTVADAEVKGELRRRGFQRSVELRENLIFSLKLFDLRFYGQGKSLLYVDTDILFLRTPTELIAAMQQPPSSWVDRYNEDIWSSYAWSPEVIHHHVGVNILPRVNAGMLCIHREELDWELFEQCLAMPGPVLYLAEQTLNAIDISKRSGMPLPPEYDVAFRHTHSGDYWEWVRRGRGGDDVVAQHYCGSPAHVGYYFDHYVKHVAPSLA